MRLFFAIDLPNKIKLELQPITSSLAEIGKHIRPVSKNSFHLTMLFLGEQPPDTLPVLHEIGCDVSTPARKCKLEISGVGFFSSVSFLTLNGELETLAMISSMLKEYCSNYLDKPDDRTFKAHITLSRHKNKITGREKQIISEKFRQFIGQSWTASELILFESRLTSSGAVYTDIARFPFGEG